MQSLQLNLPLSIYNTQIAPQNPKSAPYYYYTTSRNQTRRIAPLLATKTDGVAVKLQEDVPTTSDDDDDVEPLPDGLQSELMPRHVAIIMDGNGRWAQQRGWMASKGHEAGVRSLMEIMKLGGHWGIKVLSVFAFSCENWTRPKVEVDFLMSLFERTIKSEMDTLKREGIRVSIIGERTKLTESLKKLINEVEETTKDYTNLHLLVAVSYSGKYDVLKACKNIASQVKEGVIEPDEISEELIEQELDTSCSEFPSPDLLIRTSGELRISNFLLWQLAYTELFFAEELWPDFGKDGFVEALTSYQQRQRRYGQRK